MEPAKGFLLVVFRWIRQRPTFDDDDEVVRLLLSIITAPRRNLIYGEAYPDSLGFSTYSL